MANLMNNLGFIHIVEEIFLNLDYPQLRKCMDANESWKVIFKNPLFWLRKCTKDGKLSEHQQSAWKTAIQATKHSNEVTEKLVLYNCVLYLQKIELSKNTNVVKNLIENFETITYELTKFCFQIKKKLYKCIVD